MMLIEEIKELEFQVHSSGNDLETLGKNYSKLAELKLKFGSEKAGLDICEKVLRSIEMHLDLDALARSPL